MNDRHGDGTAAIAAADAADPAATRAAIAALTAAIGPVDLLVANAGLGLGTPGTSFDAGDFERLVRVNLLGAAHAIAAVLPAMLERGGGHLVGVSSLAGFRAMPGSGGYSATKAGLSTLLEGLRVDLRRSGVAVTIVHPGYVHTPMTEGAAHPRPWLVDADRAADVIARGIARRRRVVNFPWQMTLLLRLVRALPAPIYDRLADALRPGGR